MYVCVRARFLLAGWPAGRVLGIGQKRILPTKPKISRLITRRLIECRSFRALSARCFFSRSLPPSRPPPIPSLSCLAIPFLCRTVSPSRVLALSATSNVLRWVRLPSYTNVLLHRRPSSATVFDPPSPPSPPPPRPPPHLIHIHAVVIVCLLPAGGHYYTSCARSRHREAATPSNTPPLPLAFFCAPLLCPPSPSFLPHPRGAALRRASR